MDCDAGIFDLGGVLIDWNPRHLYRKMFPGDEPGMERFLAEVCTPQWNLELDRGRPFGDAIAQLTAQHPGQAALIAAYWERWPEMLGGIDREVVALLGRLRRRGLRLFALSNWSSETYGATRERVPELELFDDILISGAVGHVKPEPAIFEMAISRFRVDPRRTFFVDDSAANVAAARQFGLTAMRFADARALCRDLAALGVLDAGDCAPARADQP